MHWRFNQKYHWMHINNPRTFSEKIQYLKKHPVIKNGRCLADKYDVREYIKNKIGDEYLIPLVGKGVYNTVDEINFDELPNQFVFKLTKGAGYNIICPDKAKLDMQEALKKMKYWLTVNPYYFSREWQYKGKAKIICEKMLEYNMTDYKFFCFHGQPIYVELYMDRFTEHKKLFYDMNWNKMDFTTAGDYSNIEVDKPKEFNELYRIAEILAEDYPFVRVDLYVYEGDVYFGEITLHPAGGYTPITPYEWDIKLGELIDLKSKKRI